MSDSHRLVVVLPRGEAIRNFVYSGMIQSLRPSIEVTAASVHPSPDVWRLVETAAHRAVPLQPVVEHRAVRVARSLLDQAHGRHIWSEVAQIRWERQNREAAAAGARVKRLAWRAAGVALGNSPGLAFASRLERTVSKHFQPKADEASEAAIRARLVFNGSHIHSAMATPVVQKAQWNGVPTAAFLFSWDNLTSQGRLLDIYNHFLVWNDAIAADLQAMYPSIKPHQIHVTGTPQFDVHFKTELQWDRARWAKEVGVDADRPVVLYTTGMPKIMPDEPWIVADLADRLAEMRDIGSPQLLVRVYAKDPSSRFDVLRSNRPDITFSPVPWLSEYWTPLPEDTALWSSTLRHVDAGVNVASTVSLELCMFDTPVVNVAYNPPRVPKSLADFARYYELEHYRPVVDAGAVAVAHSPAQLAELTRRAILEPGFQSVGRARILKQFFGDTLDGHSAERVGAVLRDLTLNGPMR